MSDLSISSRVSIATLFSAVLSTGAAASPGTIAGIETRAAGELRLRLVPPDQVSIDLDKLSFADVSALIEGVQNGAELVLPLPFAGKSSFAPIEVRDVEVTLDMEQHTLVLAGSATVRGRGGRVFLSGTYTASGPGQYAFGVSPDALVLGEWYPALASTPLAKIEFEQAGMVVASSPHTLPSSKLVADILGLAGSAKGLDVSAGVGLRATLAGQSLPEVGQLLAALGIEESQLRLTGRLGSNVDLLLAVDQAKPIPVELDLHAELEATAMAGLQKNLPDWIRPTSLAPSLDFSLSETKGAAKKFAVALAFEAAVEIGGESRGFRLSSQIKDAIVTMRGETVGAWKRPLGIEWVTLQGATLELTVKKEELSAKLFSTIRIGAKEARLDFAIEGGSGKKDDLSGSLTARLDSITIGDLATFVSERTGTSFLKDLELGDAAQLQGMALTLAHTEQTNSLEVSATAGLGGASADLLFTLTGTGKDKVEALLAIRRHAGHLSDILPALAGRPADLAFPESVWVLTPAKAGAAVRQLSSVDLGPTAREFLAGVYGSGDFNVELRPGITLGATLPVAKLAPALVQALGIQDPSSSLILRGSLEMNLSLGTGRPSAAVQSLELHAELPQVAGASTRLPEGLPAWMRLDSSSQRTLTLRYAAPSSVTFLKTNDVLADLDGETRHFRIATEVSADSKQGKASLSGTLVGEWRQPFGLKALNLRDVTLATEAKAEAGQGAKRSGGLSLEGGFDLGPKSGRMKLEISAAYGQGVTGSFTGTLDSLAFDDLPKLDLFPNLPKEGLQRLGTTLGKLPPLEQPTLRVALGNGQPSISFGASTELRGARAHLLVFVGKGKSGPEAVVGLRPENFSLAKLFPTLAENPTVAPIANLSLDHFGLFAAQGDQTLKASEVDPEVREFFVGLTGDANFDLKLSAGLNLEAHLLPEQLPQELQQALARLSETMGLDSPGGLSLRGTIGTSLHDMRLAAALPPLRPARAPKWLKSGELAIVLTGTPSLMLAATLVVDCEGDLLNLSVEGGVTRQGANVAIELRSALQADEAWTSPFGMEWLEIRRFSGQLSIDALANIGFGGGGDVTIGSKDIDVLAWTKINSVTGIPMGLVIKGESKAGVALLDLADMQSRMRKAAGVGGPRLLPLDKLPDIALRDFALLIASRAVPEEGIDSAGFRLKGDLYIPLKPGASGTKFVAVECGVSKEGILAKGFLGAFHLGPLTWEDSYVDLEATLVAQHFLVHGRVELLGSSSETDLQFTREKFSFESTREIKGLGKTELFVESRFDLSKPTFQARGKLDNEFGKNFGDSALGEIADVGGKAAAIGTAALKAFTAARDGLEAARKEAELPTALETIDAIAAQRVKDAQAAAVAHKKEMDAKYKAWQDTPVSEPVKRKARELAWGQSKIAYDEGPMSKIKVLERRKAQYEKVHALLAALEVAKAENQRIQAVIGKALDEIAAYKGKTVVVTSASIEASLEVLQALKDGMSVDMSLELLFCGKPNTVNIQWIIGKPAENAQMVVEALMPEVCRLVNG